jgi:hypothetical protein
MTLAAPSLPRSRPMTIAGWTLSGLFIAFMVPDVAIKLIRLPIVGETMTQLGYPPAQGFTVGVVEAICLLLYIYPRTAVLGAILFMGVMGGAIASHMRIGDPLVSHTLFGVWLGLVMWGGLWLRDAKLRAVFPVRA